jgi:hypothetical protein
MENLLDKEVPKEYQANIGAGKLVGTLIGVMVVLIILVQVVIPTVNLAITNAALTGITATLAAMIPWLLALVGVTLVLALAGM